jgi:hypothetical protein
VELRKGLDDIGNAKRTGLRVQWQAWIEFQQSCWAFATAFLCQDPDNPEDATFVALNRNLGFAAGRLVFCRAGGAVIARLIAAGSRMLTARRAGGPMVSGTTGACVVGPTDFRILAFATAGFLLLGCEAFLSRFD